MAADPKAAALALHRFGLGPRAGSINRIAGDPRGALLAELRRPNAGRVAAKGLLNSGSTARALYDFNVKARARQNAGPPAMKTAMAMPAATPPSDNAMSAGDMRAPKRNPAKPDPAQNVPRQLYVREAEARMKAALAADIGFVERLVWFWSNHFCVAADKIGALAGPYERDAIRPYVLGRFADMLQAVESHPAMLIYLDNSTSIGPNSLAGLREGEGLNENLGREILELHTMGVRSGYTQTDVTTLAKIITGWTVMPFGQPRGGEFRFDGDRHEPGPQTVLGKTYADDGVEQGRAVLRDIARHPATAQHIATKLARHFVADQPPQSLIDKLAKSFIDTDGNLKELAATLVSAPESWEQPRNKLKTPAEWIAASLRVTGVQPMINGVIEAQRVLGQPLWVPAAPNGFSDDSANWMNGLPQRLDIAGQFSARAADRLEPIRLIDVALGPLASSDTRQTISFAGSRQQALTLLLLAPEFQRR